MATSLLVLIYIAFISLGLPDALLGAGWPVMQPELGVPYGFAGLVSMTISGGTILSAVFSSRVLRHTDRHGSVLFRGDPVVLVATGRCRTSGPGGRCRRLGSQRLCRRTL